MQIIDNVSNLLNDLYKQINVSDNTQYQEKLNLDDFSFLKDTTKRDLLLNPTLSNYKKALLEIYQNGVMLNYNITEYADDYSMINEFQNYTFDEQVYRHMVQDNEKYNQLNGYQERFDPYYDSFRQEFQNNTNNYIFPSLQNYQKIDKFIMTRDSVSTFIQSSIQNLLVIIFEETGEYNIQITNNNINNVYNTQSNTFMFYNKDNFNQIISVQDKDGNQINDYTVELYKQDILEKQKVISEHDIYYNKFNDLKLILDYKTIGTSQMHNITLKTDFSSYTKNINDDLSFRLNDNYLDQVDTNKKYTMYSSNMPECYFQKFQYNENLDTYTTIWVVDEEYDVQTRINTFVLSEQQLNKNWIINYQLIDQTKVLVNGVSKNKNIYILYFNTTDQQNFSFDYFYNNFFETTPELYQDISTVLPIEYDKELDKHYYKPVEGLPILISSNVFQSNQQSMISGIDSQINKTYYFTVERDELSLDDMQKSINLRDVTQRNLLTEDKIYINDERFRIKASDMVPKETMVIIQGVSAIVTDQNGIEHKQNWFETIPSELINDNIDQYNNQYWTFPVLLNSNEVLQNEYINEQIQVIKDSQLTDEEKAIKIQDYFDENPDTMLLGTRKFKIDSITIQTISSDNLISLEQNSEINLGKLAKPIKSIYVFNLGNNNIELNYNGVKYNKKIDLSEHDIYLNEDFIFSVNLGDLEGLKLVIGYEPQYKFQIQSQKDVIADTYFEYTHEYITSQYTILDQNSGTNRNLYYRNFVYETFDYSNHVNTYNLSNFNIQTMDKYNFIKKENQTLGIYNTVDSVFIPQSFTKPNFSLYLDDIHIKERLLRDNLLFVYLNIYPRDKHFIQIGDFIEHKYNGYSDLEWQTKKFFYHDENKNTMQLRINNIIQDSNILNLYYSETDFISIITDINGLIQVDTTNTSQTSQITNNNTIQPSSLDIKIDYEGTIVYININNEVFIELETVESKIQWLTVVNGVIDKIYNTTYIEDFVLDNKYLFYRTNLEIINQFTNHFEQGSLGFLKTYLIRLT